MLQLCLLRHAKSSWGNPGRSDHDRPLSRRGNTDAPRIGQELKGRGLVPDAVICSTAVRARETLRLALEAMGGSPPTTYEGDVYEAGPDELLDIVRALGGASRRLLVVGHNPTMQLCATRLSATGDADDLAALNEKYPTSGLAVIDFNVESWADIDTGHLAAFLTPRDLD
jgi:phosphohistidine phosphatase